MTDEAAEEPAVDLTRVDGIGRKSAEALAAAGITSVAQLASMTVAEVVTALRDQGVERPASRIISQGWLQQAWRLSQLPAPEAQDRSDDPELDLSEEDDGSTIEPNEWEEQAGFFVYFDRSGTDPDIWRTRVWDTRAMVEYQLPSVAAETWMAFILDRVHLPQTGSSDH